MELDIPETMRENLLLALPATDSQALVPVISGRLTASDTGAVSVYRNVGRTNSGPHPHFRVIPALPTVGPADMVIAGVVSPSPTTSLLPYPNIRAITAGNEVAKYATQISIDSNASDCSPGMSTIQYDELAENSDQRERLCIRESIVSLLLRLHSSFNGHTDSYRLPDSSNKESNKASELHPSDGTSHEEGRIGNGSFWIGKVLDKLSWIDPRVRQSIISTKQTLWPHRSSEDCLPSETPDELREKEKKKKIKERQQRLLQEFATKQKQFMQQAMAAEDVEMDSETQQTGISSTLANADVLACDTTYSQTNPNSATGSTAAHGSFSTDNEDDSYEEYDCVICNQASLSTTERPMCLVVLLQASSVLAHKRCWPTGSSLSLPVCEEDKLNLDKVVSLYVEMNRRVEILRQHFEEASWLSSLNIGYEGGVYVHTCGHYLHLDCHKQYLQSLRSQQRQQSLNVERGEYSCPLCRQLANSALPIATKLYSSKTRRSSQSSATTPGIDRASEEIKNLFGAEPSLSSHLGSNLMEAMGRVMEDMTNATFPRYRQITSTPSPASLLLFVQSIARSNLEIELMQRGGSIIRSLGVATNSYSMPNYHSTVPVATSNLHGQAIGESSPTPGTSSASWISPGLELHFSSSPTPTSCSPGTSQPVSQSVSPWSLLPKRSCLLPLLHVLATHCKILSTRSHQNLWSRIAGLDQPNPENITPDSLSIFSMRERGVPILVQDVPCLLIQMVLILPLPLERRHFVCLVQRLFNLVVVQIVLQLSCRLSEKKRKVYKTLSLRDWNLAALMSYLIGTMEDNQLYREEDCDSGFSEDKTPNIEGDIQQPLYQMGLHFLRLASLLQFHLFGDTLPSSGISHTNHEEFVELCSYLNINYELKFDSSLTPHVIISHWCFELREFSARNSLAARDLVMQHREWKGPRLLALPNSYDTLFKVNLIF